ncbi:hypothetical protein C0995_016682 [Termitomyces sp. Mi166|nr:hypothetical protein C0995_016682 [Termitomyces sp. Mi166\
MVPSTLLIVSLTVAAAHALNDWNAISDITVAAGWVIVDCSPDKLAQDIRLVCNSNDTIAAGCSHLDEGSGAEGKIVRLPESCGKNAFARVARAWIPDDQSIPESIAGKVVRRDGSQPQVKALALDTDFSAVDMSKAGPVNFAVQGANVKGAAADIDISAMNPGRRSRIYGNGIIERGLTDFVGNAIDSIKNLGTFNVNKSQTLPSFGVDQNFNLFNQSLSCPPITASLSIDVDAKANAVATLGVAASGTIVPPKVQDFSHGRQSNELGVSSGMTGDIDGSVTMKATASGTLDSGKLKIFEVGIPGLDFPGVLTIGPTFEVNAQASAGLDIEADTTVGLNYHFDNAQLVFPGDSNQTEAAENSFTIGDTPLKLSVSPSVKATGNVQAHLIPSLNLEVSALGDIVDAGIFLNLDASAEMILSLEATATASTTVDKAKREVPRIIGRYMPRTTSVAAEASPMKSASPVAATSTKSASSSAAAPANSSTVAVTKDASASFGGCFSVNAGLDVNAGADANFFGLFDENTQVPLFSKTFEILKKCFGNQKRSLTVISSLTNASLEKRAGLTCPVAGFASAVSVADQVVQAGAIVSTA